MADAVVTVDDADRVLRPGAVEMSGDRITWVGHPAEAPTGAADVRTVGGLLMPGLVNTHGHTPMTLLRSAGDGLPLERWLREVIWPREARLGDGDVHWGMLLGAAEQLGCGVTTSAEMYVRGEAVARAALAAGIRCVLAPAVLDPDGGSSGSWRPFLESALAVHAGFHGAAGRLTVGLGPHSAYALPVEALEAVAEAAGAVGAGVQIHVAETAAEDRQVRAAHGCSVPALLARLGLLEGPVLAAHSVWLDDDDLDLYVAHGVAVAHCPQSNGKLGSGVARLSDMLTRGIRVGLGTDGPASNDGLDLWGELRLAPLLARSVAAEPATVPTGQALRLATRGGADALGLPTGTLEAGRLADVVRLELDDSRFTPALSEADLRAHLVWAASSRLVTDVWVGGRPVVVGRRCLTVDGATARREVRRRAARIAGTATAGP